MLGAVSSIHCNGMNQRSIFPVVSCSGSTCTITAPPDGHTALLEWLKLVAFDNDQPSEVFLFGGKGRHPGRIGSWPDLLDFQPLPGIQGFQASRVDTGQKFRYILKYKVLKS
jgi:hypothetical protein